MKYLSLFAFLVFCFANCSQDLGYKTKIQGSWQVTHWDIGNGQTRPVENVHFEFHGDEYGAKLGQRSEAGKFRIENDKLYTHAEGQQEIMVKIQKLTADSMVFEMNRGGTPEVMTLLKEGASH